MEINTTEIIGYLGSAGVLFSFLFSDMKKLRMINIVGCGLFIVYGFLLHTSWPIIITNVSIVLINSYHLFLKKS
jgi:hypothetical protein